MRPCAIVAAIMAIIGLFGLPVSAEINRVAYPEVKVTVEEGFKPDAAFEAMRKTFAAIAAKKDAAALFNLVSPTFLWTVNASPADEFDMGRDALHNFKVVFGFRLPGKDADGGVEGGPYWETLATLAADPTFYRASSAGNLVCGPIAAAVADSDQYDRAAKSLQNGQDAPEWYFTAAETSVLKAPGDAGAPLAKVGRVALPVLSLFPAGKAGEPVRRPTHFEVLLPSGKSGFIPASAAHPLFNDRLCYAKTAKGDWKIAAYDQADN